ncbi:MAG: single-stranded DNA-binding protein [Chloroflexi bacterium]|nr:MAG: single-stranded DNA-binding protein [Chloroflexota bacterium]
MKQGLNKVMIIGWVGDDLEVRQTPSGRYVASFSVATSRSWLSLDESPQEETEWFNVVAWGHLAEVCQKELARGVQIYVEGRLHTRSWEDDAGRRHFRTEVVAQNLLVLSEFLE